MPSAATGGKCMCGELLSSAPPRSPQAASASKTQANRHALRTKARDMV